MFKKIILFVASLAFVSVAFLIYQWQDETPRRAQRFEDTAPLRTSAARTETTQPASQRVAALTIRDGVEIPPGEAPMVQVFDDKGNARIIFQATRWRPVSDVEFHLTEPTARLLLPGGQLAYVRADEGQVVVQRTNSNNYNPKRGWLRGHVQLFIDLTKPEWRQQNPHLAEPEQHPEAVWKIWLDDVDFDLDLARLHSDGPIVVQSSDARVEGRGLTLIWNEVSRRVKLLRIEEGKRASMRMKGLVRLGASGQTEVVESTTEPAESPDQAEPAPPADAVVLVEDPPAAPTRDDQTTITLTDPDEESAEPKKDRIDTYEIVFNGGVTVEQRQGLQTIGRLRAEVLELIRELGAEERSAVQYVPDSQPEDEQAPANRDATVELVWSGELVVSPVSREEPTTTQPSGDRFHVVATGNPVEIHDRETGDVFCRRLEYHDETQQVWLTGTADDLVRMQAGENRTVTGERIFLDRKAGLARVEGPGRLIDRDSDSAAAVADATLAKGAIGGDAIEVTWKRSVEIEFGLLPPELTAQKQPSAGSALGRGKEYLKRAVFDGDVAFNQPGESVTAEKIAVVFTEPRAAADISKDRTVAAESVLAEGRVRMANGDDAITCERLEVEMTTDDTGRNVPRTGRAFGRIVASRGSREIRAEEELTVNLESVPRPVTAEERERFEARARQAGIEPGSDRWDQQEERLQRRRQIVARGMTARGGVEISDPSQNLDVAADSLDCSFDDEQRITRALVVGSEAQPARVEMTDFYIRGARISMELDTQSVDVPGAGLLRMLTSRDLDGRSLDEPIPVVVTWTDRMSLRGESNAGFFSGSVRVVSQNNVLDCRELSLGFEDLPKIAQASTAPAAPDSSKWILGPIVKRLQGRRQDEMSADGLSRQVRKRLAHAHAVGDAMIASSEYQDPVPHEGPFSSLLMSLLPEALQARGPAPAARPRRLLSFVRVRGPSLTIDLNNENLVVEGAGNLLVLDYRLPEARPSAAERPVSGLAGSVAATALQSGGPSQTVFTWQNSFAFLNRRNVAVIEDRVIMKHAAGSQVVLPEEAAAAMNIDQKRLAEVKGRRAELTCDNLVVRFDRAAAGRDGDASALSSAARLKSFQASVRVRLQENNRSVEGERVAYDDDAGLVRVEGSAQLPAWIADMDPATGQLRGWRSPDALDWNLKTGEIRSRDSNIIVTGG